MSDTKKPSSPYVVLENRSLDQWKVTELKEELKRRKLITKGLKEDLVKRLDEAIRAEIEETNQNHENGANDAYHPELPSEDPIVDPIVSDKTIDDSIPKNETIEENNVADNNERVDQDNITEKLNKDESSEKDNVRENLDDENRENKDKTEDFQVVEEVSVETCVTTCVTVSEVMVSQEELQETKGMLKEEEAEPQVVEVSQVKSDSISIVSITEKNEIKDNVIADDVDVKLELDVKPSVIDDGGKTEPVVVVVVDDESHKKIAEIKNDILDVGSPEKLNLDDDSMEEDTLETKPIEKTQVPHVDVMIEDTNNTQSLNDNIDPTVLSTKRKQYEQEAVANSEVVKRQRRWNSENAPEQQNNNPSLSTTPKGMFQRSMMNSLTRFDSSVSHEEPKERVVPPSTKPATTSLRIDRFLRPFTLKAVQELLGKTGTVVSFWMDNIKTHCYVTYSSVEEAEETRNAVYNLQWPANGGRLLIAEFVDPSEVKTRTDPPAPPPATTAPPPATIQPPPHHLPPPPPLPLPPPPPLSLMPQSREPPTHLPPPPPLPEKMEPPIMTLDDLFRKTRATPRIYYLPLSDEQVAGKLKGQGKSVKQFG